MTGPFILTTKKASTDEFLAVDMKIRNQTLSSWNGAIDVNIAEQNSIVMSVESRVFNETETLTVAIETNSNTLIDIRIAIDPIATDTNGNGVIYAACLLVFLNVLIISEVNE